MKLDKINGSFELWCANFSPSKIKTSLEAIKRFENHWDMAQPDFPAVYERAIEEGYLEMEYPDREWPIKNVMLHMIRKSPERGKQLFHDLFYERVYLSSRVEHFILECDELFKPVGREIGNRFKNHFHQEFRLIVKYLQLKYPDKYISLHFDKLIPFLNHIEARKIPERRDHEDQLRCVKTIQTLAIKSEMIKNTVEENCIPWNDLKNSLLLGGHIIETVGEKVA